MDETGSSQTSSLDPTNDLIRASCLPHGLGSGTSTKSSLVTEMTRSWLPQGALGHSVTRNIDCPKSSKRSAKYVNRATPCDRNGAVVSYDNIGLLKNIMNNIHTEAGACNTIYENKSIQCGSLVRKSVQTKPCRSKENSEAIKERTPLNPCENANALCHNYVWVLDIKSLMKHTDLIYRLSLNRTAPIPESHYASDYLPAPCDKSVTNKIQQILHHYGQNLGGHNGIVFKYNAISDHSRIQQISDHSMEPYNKQVPRNTKTVRFIKLLG
ncbi:uncharacterized protein LOC103512181 [Diaphorina citri]|uniref:Uncharacterized protein LOC103512181 n=1 Tax=Diaphorina citri TaxID=121845 RepID=A0A3Q0J4J6_DIACI|nr:uncharacterized protein LOC103512181 [Diaphorina citri]